MALIRKNIILYFHYFHFVGGRGEKVLKQMVAVGLGLGGFFGLAKGAWGGASGRFGVPGWFRVFLGFQGLGVLGFLGFLGVFGVFGVWGVSGFQGFRVFRVSAFGWVRVSEVWGLEESTASLLSMRRPPLFRP